jgi:hypothetical protein
MALFSLPKPTDCILDKKNKLKINKKSDLKINERLSMSNIPQ